MALRVRRITAVGFTAVLALFGASPAALAEDTDAATSAATWLSTQFVGADGNVSPSGDHLNFPPTPGQKPAYWGGLTAAAVFGLAAADAEVPQQVLDYMHSHAAADSNLGNGAEPGAYDGSVATYALVALVTGTDPSDFGGTDLLQALKADQCTKLSAPKNTKDFTTPVCPAVGAARNIYSSVSESLAILAQARAADADAPDDAALAYFLSLQCPGGGFTQATTACTDDSTAGVDETAYAVMALQALGNQDQVQGKAVTWLAAQRKAEGYWATKDGPSVDSTGLATAALDGAGEDVEASRTWLASQQETDGAHAGALKYNGAFDASSSVKATADALLGLVPGSSLATLSSAADEPAAETLSPTSIVLISVGALVGVGLIAWGLAHMAGRRRRTRELQSGA